MGFVRIFYGYHPFRSTVVRVLDYGTIKILRFALHDGATLETRIVGRTVCRNSDFCWGITILRSFVF